MSQLVIFCLIWPYFDYLNIILPVLCVIYGTFLVGKLFTESIKLVKIVDTPHPTGYSKGHPWEQIFYNQAPPRHLEIPNSNQQSTRHLKNTCTKVDSYASGY